MGRLLSLFFFLGCLHLAHAEKDHQILYDWQNFTSRSVSDIAVDEHNIYLSTYYGIVIINKETGEQQLLDRTKGLTDNEVICIQNVGGEIWYGGFINGFGNIKDERIINYTRSSYPISYTAWITAIEKDKDGVLYVGSYRDLLVFKGDESIGIYPLPYDPKSAHSQINDIFADDDGTIWLTVYDTPGTEGLAKLTENGIVMVYKQLGEGFSIVKDKNGHKWMSARNGLLRFDNDSFVEYKSDDFGETLDNISKLEADKDGVLWGISDYYLVRYDGTRLTSFKPDVRLRDLTISDDCIYITTNKQSLLKFKDGTFEEVPIRSFPGEIPPVNMSRGGSIDHNGDYLAGTVTQGLLKLKPDGTCVQPDFFKDKQLYVSETVADKYGDIWVVCNWGNFRLFKITRTDTIVYKNDNRCPLTGSQEIFQVAVDHTDRLWIAASNGLHCFDGEKWLSYNKDNSGLTTNRVYSVAFDKLGRLWTCCGISEGQYREWGDGLFCYDFMRWTHYANEHLSRPTMDSRIDVALPLPTNTYGPIAIDEDGVFWMAGNRNELYFPYDDIDDWHGGLIRWDGKDDFKLFMRYGKDLPDVGTGLPGNWISCIEFDKYGRVWLGFEGDHGIAMYDGKDFTIWDMDVPGIGYGNVYNIAIDNERDRIWVSNRFEYGASTARMLGTNTDVMSILLPLPSSTQDSGSVYDLSGKRIPQPRRGELYIKDNRKYVMK